MEAQTVNGVEHTAQVSEEKSVKFETNNNESETNGEIINETHVTHAEVNHNTEEEPTAPKRNVFPDTEEEKTSNDVNVENETTDVQPISADEPTTESTEALPQTSENFIKIEERKVIERLSRVIDTELSIESLRVDTETPPEVNESESKSELEESKPEPVPEESVPEESAPVESAPEEPVPEKSAPEESTPVPEIITTQATEPVVTEEDESANRFQVSVSHEEENTPKEVEETSAELRTEIVENNVYESNHVNEETFKSEAEEELPFVKEEAVIKQNGRKTVYSSEEDIEEEADQMPEFTGFKNKLKLWSNGKPGADAEEEVVDKREKFKTLRQIRKGNTRSLMERFQTPSKS